MPLARAIKIGDIILLQDGRTIMKVTGVKDTTHKQEPDKPVERKRVTLEWFYNEQTRAAEYFADDPITLVNLND